MAFEPFQLLTAADLNSEFAKRADLTTIAPQSFNGQINAPIFAAATIITTDDLIVTGKATFTATDSMILPVGTTLQRPLANTFGQIRANSDVGAYEVMLGSGQWAQLVTQAAASAPANPPTGLAGISFGQTTSTSIPITWSKPSGGTPPFLFTVQYRPAGTTNWVTWLTDVPDTTLSATVSGLLDATRYEFQVSARNGAGEVTSPVTATATLGFDAGGPTNLIATSPTSTTVSLGWLSVAADPVAYQVRYAPIGSNTWSDYGSPQSDLSLTVAGLMPNQLYNFQVLAKTTAGSFESNVVQATTTPAATTAPNAATNLSIGSVTTKSLTLFWAAPNAGTTPFAYQVQYQITGAATWDNYKSPVTNTSMAISGLNSATNYSFQVLTLNSAGSSTSGTISATTSSQTPDVGSVSEFQSSGPTYPIITGPKLGSVAVNAALSITGIDLDDPPGAFMTGSMLMTITCGNGTLTMTDTTGSPINGSGTSSISKYSSTLAAFRAALDSLTYTAAGTTGSDTIRISITDQLANTSTLAISLTIAQSTGSTGGSSPPGGNSGGGLRTATGQPTDSNGILANQSRNFLDKIAINVNLERSSYNQGYTLTAAAIIENQINYIGNGGGVYFLRQAFAGNSNPTWLSQIAQNCGQLFYVLCGDSVNSSLFGQVEGDITTFASLYPTLTGAFEGFRNEDTKNILAAAVQEQTTIASLAHSKNIPAYQTVPANDASYSQMGLPPADIGTCELYGNTCPSGPARINPDTRGAMYQKMQLGLIPSPGKAIAVVEFGYSTFADNTSPIATPGWVSESVQAKYLMEGAMDGYLLGADYVGFASLQDEGAPNLYGLFRQDGTPKLAAQALRAMYQITDDKTITARSFTPGKLNYAIVGNVNQFGAYVNTGLRQLLLQNSAGEYLLFLCNEQPLNDSSSNATINVPPVSINVLFNETFMQQVDIFDPFATDHYVVGSNPAPIASYTNVTQVPVMLQAYPLILRIRHP